MLYIIIAKAIQPTVDDIRLTAMIYTLKRDDMPLLSQWINKKRTFGRQKFLFVGRGSKVFAEGEDISSFTLPRKRAEVRKTDMCIPLAVSCQTRISKMRVVS